MTKQPKFTRRYLRYKLQMAAFFFFLWLVVLGGITSKMSAHFLQASAEAGRLDVQAFAPLGLMTLLITFSMIAGLWFLNSIVGPVVKVNKHITKILNGEPYSAVTLRKYDKFKGFVKNYNSLLEIKTVKKHTPDE